MAHTVSDDRIGAFLFLAIALFIDGIDGTLARAAKVKTLTPMWTGRPLDNVIDYVTYVTIPATDGVALGIGASRPGAWLQGGHDAGQLLYLCQRQYQNRRFLFCWVPLPFGMAWFYIC